MINHFYYVIFYIKIGYLISIRYMLSFNFLIRCYHIIINLVIECQDVWR
jgi:hypothetical protein